MAALTYAVNDDVNLYARISRGFKSGGWNTDYVGSTLNLDFNPEFATAYELGIKSRLLDNRLLFNAAGFITEV